MSLGSSVQARLKGCKAILDKIRGLKGKACITFHQNADPDALASAVGLSALIKGLRTNVTVVFKPSEGFDVASKKVIQALNLEISTDDRTRECTYYFIVDTSTPTQLADIAREVEKIPYAVIDHHELNELLKKADLSLYDPSCPSASELVVELLMYSGFRPPRNVLTALITGILYDTKFFRLATYETFDKVSWLMRMGGDYLFAQKLLSGREVTRSEKIAVLKGLSRTGLYKLNKEWILAITCVGAHESSVLKELIDSGADVALAIAHRKDKIRVTARASRSFISAARKPVAAELCSYLGKTLGGAGGGHSGAAGVTIPANYRAEELLKTIKTYFQRFLGLKVSPLEIGRWMEECE